MSEPNGTPAANRPGGDPILQRLNPPQRDGVTHIEGPLLVLAGAGSGKTRLITHRIAWLVRSGVPADSILAITFTNKAAGEMRERVESILGVKCPWVSTFHSFSARILRRHIYRIQPYSSEFSIYDEDDVEGLVRDIVRGLGLDPKQWRPRSFISRISNAKNKGIRSADELPNRSGYGDRMFRDVFARYQKALEERNAADFDDLLLLVVRLFQEHPDILERYRDQFRFILIDEYQDTNLVQYQIGKLLAQRSRNLCVTGDPDQSIYSWRGADARNLSRFETDFPGARAIVLDQNYRSTGRILRTANALIRHDRERKPKDLWSENGEGESVRVRRFADGAEEARAIAEAVSKLLDRKVRGSDIAIFYRINALSREIEKALRYAVVPYILIGGVEFYQRAEVKDVIAYLRTIANPRDTESLRRIINVPARRLGDATVERAVQRARDLGMPLLKAVLDRDVREALGPASAKPLERFAVLYGEIAGLPRSPVAELIREVLRRTEFEKHLRETRGEEAEERIRNVDELVNAAAEFDATRPEGGLGGFLEEVALLAAVDRMDRREDRVSLMTLHSAKGLEFPVVFIIGLEEGILPLVRSNPDPEQEDLTNLPEERRLLYVGITRAREMLSITHARERLRYGRTVPAVPSEFLAELVDDDSLPGLDLDMGTQACLRRSRDTGFEPDGDAESAEDAQGAGHAGDAEVAGDPVEPAVDDWSEACDEDPYPNGARVRHPVFGSGTVVRSWGIGASRRLTVRFDRGGEKQLALKAAKIERI